jgi:hypothetical protein
MLRPDVWIAGIIAFALVLVVAVRPPAHTTDRETLLAAAPVAPAVSLSLNQCPAVDAREDFEEGDCLQAVRLDLLEGNIDLAQAIVLLELCAGEREDLAGLARRSAELRADYFRARLAFGEDLDRQDESVYQALADEMDRDLPPIDSIAVQRLTSAGITASGFSSGREAEILASLRSDARLRSDFRKVFGEIRADDLQALLADSVADGAVAVSVGGTTIIPNRPPLFPTPDGALAIDSDATTALAVSSTAYSARLVSDLVTLERARLRYLSSAALVNQRKGSVRVFVSSLRSFGEEDVEGAALQTQAGQDRAALAARLANFERRMGADPLLARMAGESVGIVTGINQGCQSLAENRRRWIRTGAGVVTGLVGAAGVVVATGATGTMMGGVTIAAAIEASVGAYLIARTERVASAIPSSARAPAAPAEMEEQRIHRPPADVDLDEGEDGAGGGENELWFDDFGEAQELGFLEGEGVDEDGEDSTESGPRENTIPPILPIDIPEELRELPPLFETVELRQMRDLTLPEIQERLDEFLASSDPATWTRLAEEEDVELWSAEEMLEEARASLRLWEEERELSERFGTFFIQAELERLATGRRSEVLLRAMGRYLHDRDHYLGSADIDELRRRVADRRVAHCRTGSTPGDLVLTACTDDTALSILLVAALRDAGVDIPPRSVLGVQVFGQRFEAVLFSKEQNRVYSLNRGTDMEGVVAPIYHPATFYYSYLVSHGAAPEIDVDEHLLIALPDRPMPPGMDLEECVEQDRGVVGRAVAWVGSMFGVRKVADDGPCGTDEAARSRTANRGGARNADLSIPTPRNPLQRGGGGQSGGGSGGGGSGGGQPLATNSPGDPMASGSGDTPGDPGAQGAGGQGTSGSSTGDAETAGSGGAAASDDADAGDGASGANSEESGANAAGQGGEAGARAGAGGSGDDGDPSNASGAGSGGYGVANVSLPAGPNLSNIGRETVRMAEEYDRAPSIGVTPWRLREDEGMATGSTSRVLYADNARALDRFDTDDLFITLAPAEVEAQRRMLEADAQPIYQAEADCESPNLPPRRVFRRVAAGDPGYRYVFCDQHESMVIFRNRDDAESYATLSAPDRPLYLARLASERLARFERSPEVRRLQAFLDDPNVLDDYSREQIYATVKAAADLVVFQNALESALVQSMNELGPSEVRQYYFEMHRNVMQAPFFIQIAESVYRLNQRLASDPLQSLAWANAQDTLARMGFFDLYFTVGRIMAWPDRWATLQQRYGSPDAPPPPTNDPGTSLDFLQVLSDPTRVLVDWSLERSGNPSIRDSQMQDGVEHSPEPEADPTLSDQLDRQDEIKHQRGGTGGLGQAGKGESIGPEEGRRPLQMILIRIEPDSGDPDREQLPDDNQVRPGGTEGRERRQTEDSASRQEPILWVSPQTFVEAALSNWDSRGLTPQTAGRVPPILRLNERLREVFLRDLYPVEGVYDNRLRAAMETFTRADWLRFQEVRDAMGGSLTNVRAFDMGRFSGAYSGNAPINDQEQIRIPNFFSSTGVVIPRDLFEPVREHYTSSVLGIFDLASDGRVPPAVPLAGMSMPPAESAESARANLLRSLEILRQQGAEAN